MGTEVTCCATNDDFNEKLLQKALTKKSQLEQDIMLARHNKLLNASMLSGVLSPTSQQEGSSVKITIESSTLRRGGRKNKN